MRRAIRGACLLISALALAQVACSSSGASATGTSSDSGTDGTVSEAGSRDAASDAGQLPPDAGTVSLALDGGTPISPLAFGNNYWDWIDWSKNGTSGLTGTETLATAMHLGVLRAGGGNNDSNSPQAFDTTQIDKFVAYCRTVGAEPILQVPLIASPTDGGASSPQVAADMVTYANVTQGYGVQYWEIGNEPDLYASSYDAGVPLTATDYCTTFRAYATAMTAANAAAADGGVTMHFVGPDLSWKYVSGNDWLTPFLDGCGDLIDVVSIHRYPFSAAMVTASGVLADPLTFRQVIAGVKTIVAGHAKPGTPLAVTETNVSYDYDPTKYSEAGAAAGPASFLAALWTADTVGVALESQLWSLAFWNLAEPNSTGSVLGFIVGDVPVPSYYGQELVSGHFKGNVILPSGVPTGYSVHASHDDAGGTTWIAVINKTAHAGSLTFVLGGSATPPYGFPALSLSLLQIPDDPSGATHLWQYTSDLAAPAQVQ